jgi:hypothetical protein
MSRSDKFEDHEGTFSEPTMKKSENCLDNPDF